MRTVGEYELYDAIAAGGMATVHWGRLRGPGGFSRIVAIKRLRDELACDPDAVETFLDEARMASRVRHPNVVGVLDVVQDRGEVFLVMEYVAGETLARLPATGGGVPAVPPAIASAIVGHVLEGLHAAHEARDRSGRALELVHRDVSPQNVLVGADGRSRLLDFGIAKAIGRAQVTRDGSVKGKLAYMAPEQLRSERVTRTTDVYSASVVLWELLAGRRLFAEENEAKRVVAVLQGASEPPSRHAPSLPPAADAVVMRGLARERGARPPTALAMAEALREALPPATSIAVAEWLRDVVGDTLRDRAHAAIALEDTRRDLPPAAPPSPAAAAPRVRVGSIAAIAGGALLLLMAGAAAWIAHAPSAGTMAAGPARIASAPVASTDPAPEPDPAPASASASAPASLSTFPAHASSPSPARPLARDHGAGCDPPYVLVGHRKVFKPSCL